MGLLLLSPFVKLYNELFSILTLTEKDGNGCSSIACLNQNQVLSCELLGIILH